MADRSTISNEDLDMLSRYIDGELDLVAVDRLETRLEHDTTLAQQLTVLRRNDALVGELFKSGAAIRIPAEATVALSDASNVVALPRTRRFAPLAAAATFVVGVTAVLMQNTLHNGTHDAPVMNPHLADALETLPSRAEGWDELGDGAQMRAVLTFPAADGRWCREFVVAQNEKHWRGVACRDDDTWVTQVMGSEVFLEQETQYRTAGADDDMAVARFIDDTAADVALGRQREAALINAQWQSDHAQ